MVEQGRNLSDRAVLRQRNYLAGGAALALRLPSFQKLPENQTWIGTTHDCPHRGNSACTTVPALPYPGCRFDTPKRQQGQVHVLRNILEFRKPWLQTVAGLTGARENRAKRGIIYSGPFRG